MFQVCLFRRQFDILKAVGRSVFVLNILLFVFFPTVPFVSFVLLPYLAADAALKEEHVIDGRTIDVKRAVPRDRAPLPRLVRV